MTSELVDALPAPLTVALAGLALWQWLGLVLAVLAGWLVGVVLADLGLRAVAGLTARTATRWDDRVVAAARGPVRMFLALLAFRALSESLRLSEGPEDALHAVIQTAAIVAAAWAVVRGVGLAAAVLESRLTGVTDGTPEAAARARGIRTQVRVLRLVVDVVVIVIAGALVLLQFEVVRSVGASLLASAGIAGIVVGLAAQKTIASILAGLQLSLTQPVRIGDTVIVEGEWGTVEEITLTYITVLVWDQRRLVVPITRFLDQPFQNWTKKNPELLGTIFFHADYRLPVDDARAALDRILEGNPKWDGRVKSVLVTDVTERTIQVRALISAKNAGDQWDLRCEVREKMVAWLRDHEEGIYLPRTRFEADADGQEDVAPAAEA
ncbi:MAG TPA: mechanosensitive ion channel [Polyangiaceae bacterium LLY-WYZ-14_1]|nr:mechanosensitive ion channel [Polyangiaceae bacterium LLY-WYZ-14_1]